jgi:hypothetical protein
MVENGEWSKCRMVKMSNGQNVEWSKMSNGRKGRMVENDGWS